MIRLNHGSLIAGISLWVLLVIPPVRVGMEGIMVLHALQLGLLAYVGALLARGLGPIHSGELAGLNQYGITGTVLALMTLTFWLLPASLDRSLDDVRWEIIKFISLPLLLGFPLSRSWQRLPMVVRGVLWANTVPMATVMGWLYREAPVRLCNNYLVNDQELLGLYLWGLAVLIAGYWVLRSFIGEYGPN